MMRYNPMLACDYYKTVHAQMLPKGITKSVSYFFPRSSRIPGWDSAVFFGLDGFIHEWLIKAFNDNFFDRPKSVVIQEIRDVLTDTMGEDAKTNIEQIIQLYDLGYLPIAIYALPEGSHVPMGVPMFAITNTHPDFAWLPQYLESLISCEMWHGIVAATVADKYRDIVDEYYDRTADKDEGSPDKAISCFDMRGEESYTDAVKTGAAWATSFYPCATVGTANYLEECYGAYLEDSIRGSPSTEHAVMCSNFAVDGDEVTFLRRLLTEIYPTQSFSAVLDSYDYWHMVKDVLPTLKNEIMAHKGCFLVRGDSGDAVDVVTRTVFALWDIFGGRVNSKGYKVLDPHVKAIYGDGITLQRCERIYSVLEQKGFSASNVALGVGSYSMQAVNIDGRHYPFTRDTFNIAIKATYIEVDGKPYMIQKSPKVDGAHGETVDYFKKSKRGCIIVSGEDGAYSIEDGHTFDEAHNSDVNALKCIFLNGGLYMVFPPYEENLAVGTLPWTRRRLNEFRQRRNKDVQV